LPVELVPDYYIGLGLMEELFCLILVGGDLLLADVVDEGLPLIHVDHHDRLAGL
jgi:hypothetical protein